jgi:hypothetical protein
MSVNFRKWSEVGSHKCYVSLFSHAHHFLRVARIRTIVFFFITLCIKNGRIFATRKLFTKCHISSKCKRASSKKLKALEGVYFYYLRRIYHFMTLP